MEFGIVTHGGEPLRYDEVTRSNAVKSKDYKKSFEFHDRPTISPVSGSMSMSKKQGRVGKPGMVGIFPRIGNINPAPTLALTSSTLTVKPNGAPFFLFGAFVLFFFLPLHRSQSCTTSSVVVLKEGTLRRFLSPQITYSYPVRYLCEAIVCFFKTRNERKSKSNLF